MKVIFFTPCLLFFLLPATLGQILPPGIQNVLIPCAREDGKSDADLEAIVNGDFSSFPDFFGCFSDCLAKKSGILSADNVFQVDVFKQKMTQITTDELAQQYADKCAPKAGTEECKVS